MLSDLLFELIYQEPHYLGIVHNIYINKSNEQHKIVWFPQIKETTLNKIISDSVGVSISCGPH